MLNKTKRTPLHKDVVLLIKGLLIGKIMTLIVIGGVLWWLKPQLWSHDATATNRTLENTAAIVNGSTYDRVANIPTGKFKYSGSAAWVPLRQLVDTQIQ